MAESASAVDGGRPAPASPKPIYDPPALTFPDNRITLIDAVRLTLLNDPTLRLEEQQSRLRGGILQEQSGRFDPAIVGNAMFNFTQTALGASQIKSEKRRRTDIQKEIDDTTTNLALFQKSVYEYQQLQANPATFKLTDTGEQSEFDTLNELIRTAPDAATKADYTRIRDSLVANNLKAYQQLASGATDLLKTKKAQQVSLGEVPRTNQQTSLTLDVKALFPYRDGVTLGIFGNGSFERDRYKDKEKEFDFGGKGIEDVYAYSVGFSVDAALLRGRGRDATGAFEAASKIDYDASRDVLRHAASTSVYNTVTAYWNLVAAQEQVEIARKSFALQGRYLEVTNALIKGDEIPRAEQARVLASQASDQGNVFSAERALNDARITLARAMGLSVLDDVNAPLAADPFPPLADPPVLSALRPADLIMMAIDRRYDRMAALKLADSGGILLREAHTNLRARLDFHGQISAGTVAEKSLSETSANWEGPSFQLGFDFEKPIGNNVAKGRLLQKDAARNQQTINAIDLERNIKASVVQALRSLQATADQVRRASDAVGYYGQTIDSENERFRSGQSALIDTILTQQLQTSALLNYAIARQQYATLLAQLRFETGTLVAESGDGNVVRPEDLVTLPGPGASNNLLPAPKR
ncbi:MAG: TolC family protein [Thermoanaerobaculia bacterium]